MEKKYLLLTERNKREILEFMPYNRQLEKIANFFQNFSDCTRLKILTCLCMQDMCVNDLTNILGLNQTTISHQLQTLKSEGLIEARRQGKIIIYTITLSEINNIMLSAVNCIE